MSRIETKVMASVLLIHWGRKASSPAMLKLYGLIAGVVALRELTYLRQVVYNLLDTEGVSGLVAFVTDAFMSTELTVQLALLATAIIGTLSLRDVLRTILFRGGSLSVSRA